ncbi:MAG TPA: hypothetical protein VHF45_11330 [Thermoleophilaceae bacterium]|nr:hypothetical protein [Thermoleophilaceae bacterium]
MASSCSLDRDGRARQIARYAALAPSVAAMERGARRLDVAFAAGYDRALLDELVAVERECCPFLAIEVGERSLAISVPSDDEAPMLDVFAEALGATAVG